MVDIVITISGPGGPQEAMRIPEELIPATKDAFLVSNPIPQVPDPLWIDPGDGSEQPMVDSHGPMRHFILAMQKWFLREISRGLSQNAATEAAAILASLKAQGMLTIDEVE